MRAFVFCLIAALALVFATGASAQFQGVPNVPGGIPLGAVLMIGQSPVPFCLCSSGTMANNGAMTLSTALPTTLPNAYYYLPANAISSGSAAGWYYGVASSTTAVTLYNNTYSGAAGTPVIPASPTAFATTGPGAFTQVTVLVSAYQLAMGGNRIGATGSLLTRGLVVMPTNANAKTYYVVYGAYTFVSSTQTTTVSAAIDSGFQNAGVASVQSPLTSAAGGPALSGTSAAWGAVNSAAGQTLAVKMQLGVATDYMILQSFLVEIRPGV